MAAAIAQCRHHDHPDVEAIPCEGRASPAMPAMVFLEDLRDGVTQADKIARAGRRAPAAASAAAPPLRPACTADSLATIIFSSGSTGAPKGVMLTHANVLANVDSHRAGLPDAASATASSACCRSSIRSASPARCGSRCCRAARVAYHPNPMDAKTIGELADEVRGDDADQHADVLQVVSAASARKEQFAHLRYAIVGAEKLREPLADGVPREVRHRAARRLRLHGDVAGRRGERPERRRREATRRWARKPGIGRPADSRRRGKGRRSGNGEGPLVGPARACCWSRART